MFPESWKLARIKKNKDYTWHHFDDFDPATGTCSIQYVKTIYHTATYPHYGAVKIVENFFKIIYK